MSDPRPEAIRRLGAAGIDNPRLDVRVLWDAALRRPSVFESYIRRRLAREPVAQITGVKEFWSLQFAVTPDVLVPRPESETIIEQVFDRFPDIGAPLKILDLGTGSGCLLIALLKEYPNARGLGIDASERALAVAAENLARHDLQSRGAVRPGNWLAGAGCDWDVVVANPPYIPSADIAGLAPEVKNHEPHAALDGGADGLDAYRALAAGLARLPRATAFLEIGVGQGESVPSLMAAAGLSVLHIAADLASIPRVVVTGPAAAPHKKELE